MSIQFYTPICRCVSIRNPEMIPLLLHMRWYNQRTAGDVHIVIDHPDTAEPNSFSNSTKFHSVLWDDVQIARNGSRRARLRLEGTRNDEDIFALFEFDMRENHGVITLSPVPFGLDGRPHLPHEGNALRPFLHEVAVVLSKPSWTGIDFMHRARSWTADYTYIKAWSCLCQMARLALVLWPEGVNLRGDNSMKMMKDGIFKTVVSAEQFERIFCLGLPSVIS